MRMEKKKLFEKANDHREHCVLIKKATTIEKRLCWTREWKKINKPTGKPLPIRRCSNRGRYPIYVYNKPIRLIVIRFCERSKINFQDTNKIQNVSNTITRKSTFCDFSAWKIPHTKTHSQKIDPKTPLYNIFIVECHNGALLSKSRYFESE